MLREPNRSSETLITAGFYEIFTAANAIQALTQVGFDEEDIGMVGVLSGSTTNLVGFCDRLGMPAEHALYYQSSFEEGGILLIVRARELFMQKAARAVLNERGGIFPPTIQ